MGVTALFWDVVDVGDVVTPHVQASMRLLSCGIQRGPVSTGVLPLNLRSEVQSVVLTRRCKSPTPRASTPRVVQTLKHRRLQRFVLKVTVVVA